MGTQLFAFKQKLRLLLKGVTKSILLVELSLFSKPVPGCWLHKFVQHLSESKWWHC